MPSIVCRNCVQSVDCLSVNVIEVWMMHGLLCLHAAPQSRAETSTAHDQCTWCMAPMFSTFTFKLNNREWQSCHPSIADVQCDKATCTRAVRQAMLTSKCSRSHRDALDGIVDEHLLHEIDALGAE